MNIIEKAFAKECKKHPAFSLLKNVNDIGDMLLRAVKKFYQRKNSVMVSWRLSDHTQISKSLRSQDKTRGSIFCAALLHIRFGHMNWQCCVGQKLWLDNKLSENIGHTLDEINDSIFVRTTWVTGTITQPLTI